MSSESASASACCLSVPPSFMQGEFMMGEVKLGMIGDDVCVRNCKQHKLS